MSTSFTVAFYPPEAPLAADVKHSLTLCTEAGAIGIPVTCAAPAARFTLSGDLNFGTVATGSTHTREVTVRNVGELSSAWSLTLDGDLTLALTPSSGELAPSASQTVSATVKDADSGTAATELLLWAGDNAAPAQRIPAGVSAVKTSLDIVDSAGGIKSDVRCPLWHHTTP